MVVELTVLGCSGSYGGPDGGACSGYLVEEGDTRVWIDCGNGTFGQLQRRLAVEDLTAVILTHEHPDHCVDMYGLHVMARYALRPPIAAGVRTRRPGRATRRARRRGLG